MWYDEYVHKLDATCNTLRLVHAMRKRVRAHMHIQYTRIHVHDFLYTHTTVHHGLSSFASLTCIAIQTYGSC